MTEQKENEVKETGGLPTIEGFFKTHMKEMIIGKKVNQNGVKHLIQGAILIGKRLEGRVGHLENENIGLRGIIEKLQSQNKKMMDIINPKGLVKVPKADLTIKEGNS